MKWKKGNVGSKMFELELTAMKISKQLELPYKTNFKEVMAIRHAILAHAADGIEIIQSGEFELDGSYFGRRRKGNRGRGVCMRIKGLFALRNVTFFKIIQTRRIYARS